MTKKLEGNLLTFKRKTISIDELENLSPAKQSYENFAADVLALEKENILHMIQAQGRNNRTPSIAHHYRINKHQLNRGYHKQLQTYRLKFHNAIDLDAYFKLSEQTWLQDLPYLEKINEYIKQNGFPEEKVPAPERSFELVGNEKWLEEKGTDVLQRVKLLEAMKVFPVADPLMFAVNPDRISADNHYHLIVENKTTYQALLPALIKTEFSTLLYGQGNKISKSIENFPEQFPVEGAHTFFYFGDIDRSGITIWHSLHQRERTVPARPFYEACLLKKEAYGKTNQRRNEKALDTFLTFFSLDEQNRIRQLLEDGAYYPQEVLRTKELQEIWLEADWKKLRSETLSDKLR